MVRIAYCHIVRPAVAAASSSILRSARVNGASAASRSTRSAVAMDAAAVAVELAPTPLPIEQLVAAQLLDTVVHTWDIAQSVGVDFAPPADLLTATAAIAAAIPDRAFGPGRAFATRLEWGGD